MLAFLLGQVAQKLADAGIGRLLDGPLVKLFGLKLHQLDLLADRLDAEPGRQPDRPTLYKAFHVLAADEGDMVAELLPVKLDEPMPMAVLLGPHLLQHPCCRRIVTLETLREIVVNARVFLLQRDGQGENLLFAQAFKGPHGEWALRK